MKGRCQPLPNRYKGAPWELTPVPERILQFFRESQLLFGHEDWDIEVGFAVGPALKVLRDSEFVAETVFAEDREAKTATIYIDREVAEAGIKRGHETWQRIADHEIGGHFTINDGYNPTGMFGVNQGLDEKQARLIEIACGFLRHNPGWFANTDWDDFDEILSKARELTYLTFEWDWEVSVEEVDEIVRFGEQLPVFGFSTYYQESRVGWGLLGARQVKLLIDYQRIGELDLNLPEVVLKELWRIILNPYGAPEDVSFNVQERQLAHIMKAMKALGWGKRT